MNNIFYGAVVYCKYRSLTDGSESIVREKVYAITESGFMPTIEKDKQLIEFKFDDLGKTWWYSLDDAWNDLPNNRDLERYSDSEWEIVCAK